MTQGPDDLKDVGGPNKRDYLAYSKKEQTCNDSNTNLYASLFAICLGGLLTESPGESLKGNPLQSL